MIFKIKAIKNNNKSVWADNKPASVQYWPLLVFVVSFFFSFSSEQKSLTVFLVGLSSSRVSR
jgi:hypothetical protein